MAHHQLAHDTGAIFSPSVARIAASTARDWSYVDAWLASKLPGRPVPSFERNPDTLKALLSLAALNEGADEDRLLLARADTDALAELSHIDSTGTPDAQSQLAGPLLDAIEHHLPKEGIAALGAMAAMAVDSGLAYPEAADLGRSMVDLQGSIYETERMEARTDTLASHIQQDTDQAAGLLRRLQGEHYKPAPDLAKQNLDVQRKVKTLSAQLPELQDRTAGSAASLGPSHPTLEDVAGEEGQYLALLARKKELDAQMAAFAGLPSDPDMARSELETLRRQLRGVTSRRDAVFEGLVERESPIRKR